MEEVDGWSLEDVKDMVEAVAFVPATGGVLLSYAYKPALLGDAHQVENRLGLPPYKSSEAPFRSGANLVVQVLLPESLATDLRQGLEAAEASKDPRKIQEQTELFRTMVQEVVINCGGVSRSAWENGVNLGLGDERRSSRLKPPYDELPPTHRMFLVEPKTDKNDRQFMVARRIGEPVS
ncbi:MAG TPA: hypothetical protein VKQ34_02225 [Candidatus Saccharimonadales bacterium]|nr:hypothetical protein [Candidatus Saccharimonadales bacterium]